MRIAWFTPFAVESAIGEFSKHVTDSLSRSCSVDLWIPDHAETLPSDLAAIRSAESPACLESLGGYDVVVYNFGNHVGFHRTIYEISRQHRGIAILHDRVYHHMLAEYWLRFGLGASHYLERMQAFYGGAGRRRAEAGLAGRQPHIWESDEEVVNYPLFEEMIVSAEGVVVHSSDQETLVAERCFRPIRALFLPSYPTDWREDNGAMCRSSADRRRLMLLTVGDVNPNKHVHRVIEALGRDQALARRLHYVVIGRCDEQSCYGRQLRQLIRRYSLETSVSLLGYQPAAVLRQYLVEADAFVNLRYPSWEGGSASLMRQLAFGKPILVYDVGSFAELPNACAVKIPPLDDSLLVRALRWLTSEPELRCSAGVACRETARALSVDRYAEEFLAFCAEVGQWRPVLSLCERVGRELGTLGIDTRLAVVTAAAEAIDELNLADGDHEPLSAPGPSFREIQHSDAEALAQFFVRNDVPAVTDGFYPFALTRETALRIAHDIRQDRYYGAFLHDRIVGLSMLRGWDEGYATPSLGIVVDRDFQGRGIGSRMTAFTIDQAQRLGCARVRLTVDTYNSRAYRMYSARGFVEQSREKVDRRGRSVDRIVMAKELYAVDRV
jgi:glycosyltransferase involved in cell wall biosynthesis/RimJ/RimL family protein N-acetyltransferase